MAFVGGLIAAATILLGLAVIAFFCRHRVLRWLSERVAEVTGTAVVDSLPPRMILSALLRKLYGDDDSHRALLVGILGGAGLDVWGRDIATSRRTTVDIRLRSIDEATHSAVITWTHRLSGLLDSYDFVVFATCDPELFNLIPSERRSPLYESWFVRDETFLERFVPTMRESLEVGVTYRDVEGRLHVVEPRALDSSEPRVRHYGDFLEIPEGVDLDNLRILHFDLSQLVDPDHVVDSIESLTVRAEAYEPTVEGFITWSPPYPCYVEKVAFDVAELHGANDGEFAFKIVPFTMLNPGPTLANTWGKAHEVKELALGSWLLPGHGVTLLWRPVDRLEPRHAV